jgi:hypothetical protein
VYDENSSGCSNPYVANLSKTFINNFNQACEAELAFRQKQQTAIQAVKLQQTPPSALEGYKTFGLPSSQLSTEQPIELVEHDNGDQKQEQSAVICKT